MDVKVVDSPNIHQYILVFEDNASAQKYFKETDLHQIDGSSVRPSLITDREKLKRFGMKIKNFVDNPKFGPGDNDRRIVVTSVSKNASAADIENFFAISYPTQTNIHRCEIDQFFFGVYVISFESFDQANNALKISLQNTEMIRNPLVMLLSEYYLHREKYLNTKQMHRKKRTAGSAVDDDKWMNEFSNIEKLHEKHWGKMEPINSNNIDDDSQEEDNGYDPMQMLKNKIPSSNSRSPS